MRILIVSNLFAPHVRGGYELGCQRIAERCHELGHETIVATSAAMGKLENTARHAFLRIEEVFEPVYEYDTAVYHLTETNPIGHARRHAAFGGIIETNARSLARLVRRIAPDLIWIFNPLAVGPVGVLEACLTSGAPCVLHLMDDLDTMIGRHQSEQYLLPRYRHLKASLHAIACSAKMAAANTRLGEFASMRIIPNGVEFAETARPDTHVSTGPVRFVYFGQVDCKKGVLQALRGFRALLDRRPGAQLSFDVIGRCEPYFRDELEREQARLGLRETVHLHGFVPHRELLTMLPRYTAAVLLLSDDEPFGYAPIEAVVNGLPVIMTPGPGATECFPLGYPLFVTDRESDREVADQMEWCIVNPESARRLAGELRAELRRKCDFIDVVFPAYENAVKSLERVAAKFDEEAIFASDRTVSLYRQSPGPAVPFEAEPVSTPNPPFHALRDALSRIPVIGYSLHWLVDLLTLPIIRVHLVREIRDLERRLSAIERQSRV